MTSAQELFDAYKKQLKKSQESTQSIPSYTPAPPVLEPFLPQGLSVDHQNPSISDGFSHLKSQFRQSVDLLERQYMSQYKLYMELQQKMETEKRQLEEVLQIKIQSQTLGRILKLIRDKHQEFEHLQEEKRQLEQEVSRRQLSWMREQKNFDEQLKEREREEKSFLDRIETKKMELQDSYEDRMLEMERSLMNKREILEKEIQEKRMTFAQELEEKQLAFEKACFEREAAVGQKELELVQLREKVDAFPVQLQKASREAEKAASEKLVFQYNHVLQMTKKESETEVRLLTQKIGSLEKELDQSKTYVHELKTKLTEAEAQLKQVIMRDLDQKRVPAAEERLASGESFAIRRGTGYPHIVRSMRGQ